MPRDQHRLEHPHRLALAALSIAFDAVARTTERTIAQARRLASEVRHA